MQKEKTVNWTSQVLIPFSILGNVHAILSHLPSSSVKPVKLSKTIPCFPYYKPRTFEDNFFELGFMDLPHRVFHSSPPTNNETYINWFNKMEKKKGKI